MAARSLLWCCVLYLKLLTQVLTRNLDSEYYVDYSDDLYGDYRDADGYGDLMTVDLMRGIDLEKHGHEKVDYTRGIDGLPAFSLYPGADVRIPSVTFFAGNILFRDFSILVTLKPDTNTNGMLFSFLVPDQTLILFGVGLTPVQHDNTVNITFYYTDYTKVTDEYPVPVASFAVPAFTGEWTQFALSLQDDVLSLYFNCDELQQELIFARGTMELPFADASTLFIAQAGDIYNMPFEGALQELKIHPDSNMAKNQCPEEDGSGRLFNPNYTDRSILGDPSLMPEIESDWDVFMDDKVYWDLIEEFPTEDHSYVVPNGGLGPPGNDGAVGPKGQKGERGLEANLTAATPLPGLPGQKGAQGETGEPGEDGRGLPGSKGDTGPAGPKGDDGLPGKHATFPPYLDDLFDGSGDVDLTADDGAPGIPGEHGSPGSKGDRGDAGPPGLPGSRGIAGAQGPPGDASVGLGSCLEGVTLHEICRKLDEPMRVSIRFFDAYADLVTSVEDVFLRHLQSELANSLNIDPNRLKNFKIEEDSSTVTFDVMPATEVSLIDVVPSVEEVIESLNRIMADGAATLYNMNGFSLNPDPTFFEASDIVTEATAGPPGPMGPMGPLGFPGSKGDAGLRGEPGLDGLHGLPGPPGPPGMHNEGDFFGSGDADGIIPIPGRPGARGDKGVPGLPGLPGHQGDVGDRGLTGLPGFDGQPGEPGARGDYGLSGERGAKGERGEPGIGERGLVGPEGPPGPPGRVYDQDGTTLLGPPGPKGDTGSPGLPGDPGSGMTLPGQHGIKGDKGAPGDSMYVAVDDMGYPRMDDDSNIQILRPLKGQKGEDGTCGPVDCSQTGDSTAVGAVRGPPGLQGRKGERGFPGIVGELGLPGMPGYNGAKGSRGSPGIPGRGFEGEKGERGMDGPPGRVVRVDGGDVVPGVKGDRGVPGESGEPGRSGLPGRAGIPGVPGVAGIDGLSGTPGNPGPQGSDGLPGRTGERGETGPVGPPGLPGTVSGDAGQIIEGRPGNPGTRGPPGPSVEGLPGSPGPIGPPGPPGSAGTEIIAGPSGAPGPPGPIGPPGPPGSGSHTGDSTNGGADSVSGIVSFQTMSAMRGVSRDIVLGTLAFVYQTERLYLRISSGWREILMGSYIPITSATTPPPYTVAPPGGGVIDDTSLSPGETPSFDILEAAIVAEGKMIHLVAANYPFRGDMRGIRGADYVCHKEARLAGYKGTYRAFLTSRDQDIAALVPYQFDRRVPIVNSKNEIMFNSWDDMFNGGGGKFNPALSIYSFEGKDVLTDTLWPQKVIWHGADQTGKVKIDSYCLAWNDRGTDAVGVGSAVDKHMLLDVEYYSCASPMILLCTEIVAEIYTT